MKNVVRLFERKFEHKLVPNGAVSIICAVENGAVAWDQLVPRRNDVLYVDRPAMVHVALAEALAIGCEVERIVFDNAIDARSFLTFLTRLSIHFRGDAILISGNDIFLSVLGTLDSRGIHTMQRDDLDFYLDTHFGRHESEFHSFLSFA